MLFYSILLASEHILQNTTICERVWENLDAHI